MWIIALFIAFIETIVIACATIYMMVKGGSGSGLVFLFAPVVMLVETIRTRAVIAFGNTDSRAYFKVFLMAISGGISFLFVLAVLDGHTVRNIGIYWCLGFGAIFGILSAIVTILVETRSKDTNLSS